MLKETKRKLINVLSITLLVGVISFSGVSLAKYVSQGSTKTPIEPGYFHFNCSKVENETYVLNIKGDEDTASTTFTVNNYVFDSYSQDDIFYSVDLIDDETSVSTTIKNGVLTKNKLSEETVEINGLVEGKTYTVKVHSNAPYFIEYSFKYFVAKKELNTFYIVTDNGSWIQLDLYIGDTLPTQDIIIVYENKLTPNPTASSTEGWELSGSHTISKNSLQVNTHYVYEFVELTSGNHEVSAKTEIINNKINL